VIQEGEGEGEREGEEEGEGEWIKKRTIMRQCM